MANRTDRLRKRELLRFKEAARSVVLATIRREEDALLFRAFAAWRQFKKEMDIRCLQIAMAEEQQKVVPHLAADEGRECITLR
ncbi:unnamed protein product [Symbiodinium natans]|uniref:Uncharacterized protein n=1 Tax=Symbiodinium natans TaxID=878477 RepID=A0A812RN44_9DINO|nr:unnamed protein product [Symbiodinium natans]